MCRMMAKVQQAPSAEALQQFRGLCQNGKVLPDNACGHADGWGIAGFLRGALTFFEKSALPASEDERFDAAVDQLQNGPMDVLLCHLRKASRGDVTEPNAHPFRRGVITFCHNGGIRRSDEIPIYDLQPEGGTDSERFFLNMAGRLMNGEARTLMEAAGQTVRFIHDTLPYSSLCFFLTDGTELLAYRDYRDTLRPEETEPPKNWDAFPGYYTLYYSDTARAVSSEPVPAMADDWALMDNGEVLTMRPDGEVTRERLLP